MSPVTTAIFILNIRNDIFILVSEVHSSLNLLWFMVFVQDNVFVTVVASIQYRALADKAADAFYKLSNTRAQIQAYVFDGTDPLLLFSIFSVFLSHIFSFSYFFLFLVIARRI